MDGSDCHPPSCVVVIEAPAEATDEVLQEVLEPVSTTLETISAATGWGLEIDYDEAAFAALPRHRATVPTLDGLEISYVVSGDPGGRRIILVHGAPGEASEWGRFLLDVPPGLQFVALDRPGYGESGPEEGGVTALAGQVAALAVLLETHDGRRPLLVGYSLGGPIVAQVAATHGDEIGALMLIGGALDPALENPSLLQYVAELEPVSSLLPRELDSANQELLELGAELTMLVPLLPSLAMPISIVHGTRDNLVPVENVAFMQDHLTGADPLRIVLVDGADHFLPWSHYDLLREVLLELVADLEAKGR